MLKRIINKINDIINNDFLQQNKGRTNKKKYLRIYI